MMFIDQIAQLCAPLERLKIKFFSHVRIFPNNDVSILCTDGDVVQKCAESGHFQAARYNKKPGYFESGYYLWENDILADHEKEHAKVLKKCGLGNGFTIVRQEDEYCDYFHFASTPDNDAINNFYLNNIDLLEKFVLYFEQKTKELRLMVDKMPISMKQVEEGDFSEQAADFVDPAEREAFIIDINQDSLIALNDPSTMSLTSRQKQCVYWLLKGKTAWETARILNLSQRTVEHYLQNIKAKLNCRTKFELISKVLKSCPNIELLNSRH